MANLQERTIRMACWWQITKKPPTRRAPRAAAGLFFLPKKYRRHQAPQLPPILPSEFRATSPRPQIAQTAMASPEPATEPSLAQESPTPTPAAAPSAAQEGPPQPQEPVPEAAAENAVKAEGEEEEEEEEGECGFCLFMKAGGCRDTFVAWEECVEAAQKDGDDMVERCHEATANLKKCMDAHADYYAPLLRAEEAVNERAEAEAAAAAAAADDDAAKDKGGEPATDSENKEEGVPQPAASSPPAAGVGNDAENKEEAVPQPAASSPPAAGEAKKEEAVAEKV